MENDLKIHVFLAAVESVVDVSSAVTMASTVALQYKDTALKIPKN